MNMFRYTCTIFIAANVSCINLDPVVVPPLVPYSSSGFNEVLNKISNTVVKPLFIIYREPCLYRFRSEVSIDGEVIGFNVANSYFFVSIDPGKHVIDTVVEDPFTGSNDFVPNPKLKDSFTVFAREGEVYFLKQTRKGTFGYSGLKTIYANKKDIELYIRTSKLLKSKHCAL